MTAVDNLDSRPKNFFILYDVTAKPSLLRMNKHCYDDRRQATNRQQWGGCRSIGAGSLLFNLTERNVLIQSVLMWQRTARNLKTSQTEHCTKLTLISFPLLAAANLHKYWITNELWEQQLIRKDKWFIFDTEIQTRPLQVCLYIRNRFQKHLIKFDQVMFLLSSLSNS